MVISHMPGVQDLAMHLASRDSNHDAYMDAATRYPTSGLTVFETEKSWAELDGQDARLDPLQGAPGEVAGLRGGQLDGQHSDCVVY